MEINRLKFDENPWNSPKSTNKEFEIKASYPGILLIFIQEKCIHAVHQRFNCKHKVPKIELLHRYETFVILTYFD